MKIASALLTAVFAQDCGDITLSPVYQSVAHANAAANCDGSADGSVCKLKCAAGYALHSYKDNIKATCKAGAWDYGVYGGADAVWGCCQKSTGTYGFGHGNAMVKRNYNRKYVEASATYALLGHKVKMKAATTNGYSFMLEWKGLVPEDVTFETFARLEVTSIYRDTAGNKTIVLLSSRDAAASLSKNDRFDLTFGMRSAEGGTNMKQFVEEKNYKLRFFDERQTHWCPGNSDLEAILSPSPNLFGSFNIQVFGQTKYGKTIVKDKIVEILMRYDISTIQEIRDSAETAFPKLVADMNAIEDKYDWHTGIRQGSTSSKEQEGFIWDRNKFSMHDNWDFEDTQGWFERPPTVVYMNSLSNMNAVKKFMIISTHIKPESGSTDMTTENEINHLADVYTAALARHPEYVDAIIAGDMNADCTYVKEPETTLTMLQDPTCDWLIPFTADTTVKDTDCAYDHIIVKGENMRATQSGATVFNYDTFYNTEEIFYEDKPITDLISDHYPVEFYFA